MKVTLQITKKPKKGSIAIEARYEEVASDSFLAVRMLNCMSYFRLRVDDSLELVCLKFGVTYEAWTRVWVRLQVRGELMRIIHNRERREQANDFIKETKKEKDDGES